VLQVVLPPGIATAEACCKACAATAGCGAAACDGSACSPRSANSVPAKVSGAGSCDFVKGANFHPGADMGARRRPPS